MGLKQIFTVQKPDVADLDFQEDDSSNSVLLISGITYSAKGTADAGLCGGSVQALIPKLNTIYMHLVRIVQQDKNEQNSRKNKIKQKISGFETENANFENTISAQQKKLEQEEGNIAKTVREINEIKENPDIVSGDSFAKASFWIGLLIILFLTVYLFVFYSSASYSAFFKNFSFNDTNVAQAIFDAQAITKAWIDGFTELVFILAIPAVFLGLGFLIHKFSEEKGVSKYFKILGLIIVTFSFDFIIAYEIVEKIYNIKVAGSFVQLPEMTISMAVHLINFWLIIFAGFVVYIIWGLVFNFTMVEYEKMNKVQYTIKIKQQKIAEYKKECKQIREEITNLQNKKNNTQGEIDKLKIALESHVIYIDDIRAGVNDYFAGWIGFLKAASKPQSLIQACNQQKEKFFSGLQQSEFIIDA